MEAADHLPGEFKMRDLIRPNRDFVCPECYFKISEITPKHFSFNSPEGACAHCSGLGNVKEVDEDLVAPNKKLSLSEGAILAWNKSGQENILNLLRSLGGKYKFSIDAPLEKLTREQLNVIFYGCPEFEGVIPGIKKKYEEISSSLTKSDIEKYMIERPKVVSEYIFISKTGKPLAVRNIRASVDRFIQKAELPKYSVNDLRTTFIVENIKNGVDLILISQVAGHKRLSTTERYIELAGTTESSKKQSLIEL